MILETNSGSCATENVKPPRGQAFSLAHGPVPSYDTICNNLSTLLHIVLFELSLLTFPQGSKTCLLGRVFHTLIKNILFLSPTNRGISHVRIDSIELIVARFVGR